MKGRPSFVRAILFWFFWLTGIPEITILIGSTAIPQQLVCRRHACLYVLHYGCSMTDVISLMDPRQILSRRLLDAAAEQRLVDLLEVLTGEGVELVDG